MPRGARGDERMGMPQPHRGLRTWMPCDTIEMSSAANVFAAVASSVGTSLRPQRIARTHSARPHTEASQWRAKQLAWLATQPGRGRLARLHSHAEGSWTAPRLTKGAVLLHGHQMCGHQFVGGNTPTRDP
eukprot:365071-Chlamydomonas_euryale.AAC.5